MPAILCPSAGVAFPSMIRVNLFRVASPRTHMPSRFSPTDTLDLLVYVPVSAIPLHEKTGHRFGRFSNLSNPPIQFPFRNPPRRSSEYAPLSSPPSKALSSFLFLGTKKLIPLSVAIPREVAEGPSFPFPKLFLWKRSALPVDARVSLDLLPRGDSCWTL